MSVQLNSYISFRDNAREAMDFYKSVFGGEVYADTFEKFADQMPVDDADRHKIMHAYLKGDNGIELMGADTPSSVPEREGSRITLSLSGDDELALRQYWDALVDGGDVVMPLENAPWGDVFGMLTDKYGVGWMVNVTKGQ